MVVRIMKFVAALLFAVGFVWQAVTGTMEPRDVMLIGIGLMVLWNKTEDALK